MLILDEIVGSNGASDIRKPAPIGTRDFFVDYRNHARFPRLHSPLPSLGNTVLESRIENDGIEKRHGHRS